MCYVERKSNENLDLTTPKCLRNMSVVEVLVNRWIPQQNRSTNETNSKQTQSVDSNLFTNVDNKWYFNDALTPKHNDSLP